MVIQGLGNEKPTQQDLTDFVIRMRQKGLLAASCNNRIRAVNAYLHWSSNPDEVKCGADCKHLHISKSKKKENVRLCTERPL